MALLPLFSPAPCFASHYHHIVNPPITTLISPGHLPRLCLLHACTSNLPPPSKEAQRTRCTESRESKPEESGISLRFATSHHAIGILTDRALVVLAAVDDDIVGEVGAIRIVGAAGAGVGA